MSCWNYTMHNVENECEMYYLIQYELLLIHKTQIKTGGQIHPKDPPFFSIHPGTSYNATYIHKHA